MFTHLIANPKTGDRLHCPNPLAGAIDRTIKLTLTDKKIGIQIDLVLTTEALIN